MVTKKQEIRNNIKLWRKRPKHLRKLGPLSVPSKGLEAQYSLLLRREVQRIKHLILHEVSGLASEKQDAKRPEELTKKIESTVQRLRRTLRPKVPLNQVKTVLGHVNDHNLKSMNAVLIGPTAGIPIWTGTSAKSQVILTQAFKENVDLIKTIPDTMLDRVEETLTRSLKQGMNVNDISGLLQDDFAISDRRADLIARDQVLKVNGQLVEQRSSEAGITGYIWDTSKDQRVRPMHKDLEGTKQSWDDPPVTNEAGDRNHPGGDYQCRCNALPDVDSLLSSLEAGD
jgi:SPP1 gp7 family putative phage head morphogenesis protein